MLRRDGIAGRIYREDRELIDRQPGLPRDQIPDIPLRVIHDLDDLADWALPLPPPPKVPWKVTPFPPPISGEEIPRGPVPEKRRVFPFLGEGLKKVTPPSPVIPPVTDGGAALEERGEKLSIYIIIGAVIIVGFLAMRR